MNLVQTPSPLVDLGARPRRSKGLVSEVVQGLTQRIRAGHIKAGDKLPTESEIVHQFDVSRTVVREAISHLQANRLVETRHGIGTFALEPQVSGNFQIADVDWDTLSDVIALLELRISLETEAAGLAAQRRTQAHLVAMDDFLRGFATAIQENSDAVPLDFNFHLEVAKATGNRHFAELMAYLGTMIIPRTRVNTPSRAPEGRLRYLRKVHAEHERIYIAIRDQDSEAARSAMRSHLANSKKRLSTPSENNQGAME